MNIKKNKKSLKLQIIFYCLIFISQLFPQDTFSEIGIIHKGDGEVLKPGIIKVNQNIIETICQYNDSLYQEKTSNHITPTFFNLNIYDSNSVDYYDSLFVKRGIVYYLVQSGNKIYFHKVAPFTENKLAGYFYENQTMSTGEFHEFYHQLQDNLAFSKYYLDVKNIVQLPHEMQLSVNNFKHLLNDGHLLWLKIFTKNEFELISELLIKYNIRLVYLPIDIEPISITSENINVIINLTNMFTLSNEKLLIDNIEKKIGFNVNLYFQIYDMEKLITGKYMYDNPILQLLSKEEFLQYSAILPSQFFGMDEEVGMLREGYSANFIVFSDNPFKKDSYIKKVFVDGIEIYSSTEK